MASSLPGPRTLALVGDYNGCTHWRILQPFEALVRQGYHAAVAHKDDDVMGYIEALFSRMLETLVLQGRESAAGALAQAIRDAFYEVVILPRMSWFDHRAAAHFIDKLHSAGICVILEVDDDLFSPNVSRRIQQTVERDAPLELLERKRLDRLLAMRLCDGVTVSSQRLATLMRNLTDKPVVVIPNAIDTGWWRQQMRQAKRTVPGLTIGWAGGARPDDDLEPMAEAWGRIARRYPDVTFVCYGYQPAAFTERVPADRLVLLDWQPIHDYARPMRNIDIGCAAVADSGFNRCKTPIKCWEYCMAGAAVVATPTLYRQAVEHCVDGLLAESANEWEAGLSMLIEDHGLRRSLNRGQRRRVATEHSLDKNLWRWPAAWAEIVSEYRVRAARPRLYLPAGVGA